MTFKHIFVTSISASAYLFMKLLVLATLAVLCPTVQADTKVRASSFEYSSDTGLLTREVVEPDSPNDCLQTFYTYDPYGNKRSISTAACAGAQGYALASAGTTRTGVVSFGADGRFAVSSSNALGQSETKAYDSRFGVVSALTGPNGLTTTWAYDAFGRKTRETRADATYTTWAYRLCAEAGADCPGPIGGATVTWVLVEQSYAVNAAVNAPERRQYHDALNRVVRVQTQGFDGVIAAPVLVQDTEFNALGQVARKSNVYAVAGGLPLWSNFVYDVLGRPVAESHPESAVLSGMATSTFSYSGLVTSVTNAKGQTRVTTKNAQGLVAQVVDAAGNSVTYSYDALGQLLGTNAAGSTTTMAYNQRGQKVAMLDPAMGSWVYAYNVFGELVYQRDSLGQSTTMTYDLLGRLTQRLEPDLVSQWSYDRNFDDSACGKSIGKLCEARTDGGYSRKHAYDALGRASSTATVLDSAASTATVSVSFDTNTGRVVGKTWPSGYQAGYTYSPLGYLKTVTGGGSNGFVQTVSYDVQAMDAQGQITQYRHGNQVTTARGVDPATGRLTGQTATRDGQTTGNVLSHTYTYDALGNLLARLDNTSGVGTQESFGYDSLNRLTLAAIQGGVLSGTRTTEVMYDARGNISYKSDVGRYWYDAARPNRMTNITLETSPGAAIALTGTRALAYAFDDSRPTAQTMAGISVGNGNLEYTVSYDATNNRHTLRGEVYTSFNMPGQISYGNFITSSTSTSDRVLSFTYGPEHQRVRQDVSLTGNGTSNYFAGSTWYLNGEDGQGLSYEKEVRANGTTEERHFVSAGGVVFALVALRTGSLNGLPASSTSYFHHDQLGSVAVTTNEAGVVVERLAYDPWGKRRFINTAPGSSDNMDAIVGLVTDRGYTMHEHLDEVGVIHMNGRIYDPLVGRFMSADPFIQGPENLQSYNRYIYALNNPFLFTDPSGHLNLGSLLKPVINTIRGMLKDPVRTAAAIAVAYYTGQYIGSGIEGASWASTASSVRVAGQVVNTFTTAGSAVIGAGASFAASYVASGGNLRASLRDGLVGGINGAFSKWSTTDWGMENPEIVSETMAKSRKINSLQMVVKSVSQSAVKGLLSAAQGNDFWKEFNSSLTTSLAHELYRTSVPWSPKTVGPGGPGFDHKSDHGIWITRDGNDFGTWIGGSGLLTEGGRASRALDGYVPFMDAISKLHDVWTLEGQGTLFCESSVCAATMPFAAILSISAVRSESPYLDRLRR